MSDKYEPVAIHSYEATPKTRSNYPPVLVQRVAGRERRALGDAFGLKQFGVNETTLLPGAWSALRHFHARQDEFVYILKGHPTLITNEGKTRLSPGMCAGFRSGHANGHHLVNETGEPVVYLEVGDRTPGDEVTYPDEDLRADFVEGQWAFSRKDGSPL